MDNTGNTNPLPRCRDFIMKLYSVNIRGLAMQRKGEQALTDLLLSKYNVFFVQETHIYNEIQINRLKKIWKGQTIWDLGQSKSCGVAILIKENVPFKIVNIQKSGIGRYIIIDGILNEQKIRLVNVYFPNTDKLRIDIIHKLEDLIPTNDTLIVGGDFNFAEEPKCDKSKGRMGIGSSTRKAFKPFKDHNNLVDIFRFLNPNSIEFTYCQPGSKTKTRIDRIYADDVTVKSAIASYHEINTFADHSAVIVFFKFNSNIGPGYWKCNTSVLEDIDFNADFLALWKKLEKRAFNDYNIKWWDDCKTRIKDLIIWHSSRLQKNRADKLNLLDKEINNFKKLYNCENGDQHPLISEKIAEKTTILKFKCEGARIRAKIDRILTDEKPIEAFLHLEKRKAERKTIKKLTDNNGKQIEGIKPILEYVRSYYSNLFSSEPIKKETWPSFLSNIPKLNALHVELCEGPILYEEAITAIKQMAEDKSPGSDGLPAEFYKKFFSVIGPSFIKMINNNLTELSESQRLGVITLLCKNEDKAEDLNNWRILS
jgi:exonuclease III